MRRRGSPVPGIALFLVLWGSAGFLQSFYSRPSFDGSREHDRAVLQQELVDSGQSADFQPPPWELERQYLEMEERGYVPLVAPLAPNTTPPSAENTRASGHTFGAEPVGVGQVHLPVLRDAYPGSTALLSASRVIEH